ncbi:MAG: replicative DNA helicase [Patescibacteria group bacterium]|mgnify:FL=1|nr:replicative DNA helicase [Patescibacteria group bacterium]
MEDNSPKGLEKIPPQNQEAEVSVLGSILLDKDAIIKVADILIPDDFYNDSYRIVYDNMIWLYEHHQPIDVVTLTNRLEEKKKLKAIGGATLISQLANAVPSAAHVINYAKIVSDKALLRRLITTANEVVNMAFDESDSPSEVLDRAEKKIFEVSEKHLKENFISLKSVLAESFDRIDELHKDKESLRGVSTGFKNLDNVLAGLQPSDLVIIAGRPSMGKTAFALNIAHNVAVKDQVPVAIFSLEMSKEQLVDRLLASEAGIDSWKLRTGNLDDNDFLKINHAYGALSEAPLFIDDSSIINVLEMRTKARRLQSEHGLGLIIIDYLQLMSGNNPDNRVQEVSAISRSLKGLARELNVPVVALSQLSRAVEQRPSKIPQLSDLRESGSIEQDADVVMFVYREEAYDEDTERKNIMDILIRKHRNGPIGQAELYFKKETQNIRAVEKKRQEV